jgi:hypothetical protein
MGEGWCRDGNFSDRWVIQDIVKGVAFANRFVLGSISI